MAGGRLKRKQAKRTTEQVEKRRKLRRVLQSVLCQLLLWGCWISVYFGWIPDDEPTRLMRLVALAMPIVLYIAPLLFCILLDFMIDWIRGSAWSLVTYLWAPWFLSLLLGKERSINDYVKAYPPTRLHTNHNGDTIRVCSREGLHLWAGYVEAIVKAYKSNKSWAGTFSLEDLRMNGHVCRINKKPSFCASFDNLLLDFSKLAHLLIDYYKGDGKKAESYMLHLYRTMISPPVGANSSGVQKERFLKFLQKHLAFRSPHQKKIYILEMFKVLRALGLSAEKAALNRAVGKINVKDWREVAGRSALLRRTLFFRHNNPNNTICIYGPGPEELLRFVRNFFEHGGDADANGQQVIGSLEDIECAGPDIFPSFTIKLTYQLVMLLDMGGQLDYVWENLE